MPLLYVAALLGSLFLVGFVYGLLPIGVEYVLFGFPIGILLGAWWIFQQYWIAN